MVLTPKVVDSGDVFDLELTPDESRERDRGTLIVRANPEFGGSRTVVSTPRLYQRSLAPAAALAAPQL